MSTDSMRKVLDILGRSTVLLALVVLAIYAAGYLTAQQQHRHHHTCTSAEAGA